MVYDSTAPFTPNNLAKFVGATSLPAYSNCVGSAKKYHCKRRSLLCHCIQKFLLHEGPIGGSEKCHCKRGASNCITVTGVTVSGEACISVAGELS